MARWDKISARGRVTDRRSAKGGLFAAGGLGTVLLLAGITYLFGGNPLDILLQADPGQLKQSLTPTNDTDQFEGEDEYELFVSTVLGSANEYWHQTLSNQNISYREPTLVLFRNSTTSACGGAQSYTGPHYCPLDETIYIDETFFDELTKRFGASGGDVAEAYVIAHEVGHHVQNITGQLETRPTQIQQISIELTADCYAGLWAHSLRDEDVFLTNEIQEAIDAAAAVGDDNVQRKTTGTIQPESWTHGSSTDRVKAFNGGYVTGDVKECLTL